MNELKQEVLNLEYRQTEINDFINKNDIQQVINLNVGGKDFVVGRETLTSINNSLLALQFSGSQQLLKTDEGTKIFLDRDPEVFTHIVTYLRSGRQFLPINANEDMKKKVQIEIKYWQLDKGLKEVDSLQHSDAEKIQTMLSSIPKLNPNYP